MCLKFCLNGASFLVLIFPVHYTVKGEANPIDSSAKATPSRVIKLGYLVMADTHKDSLDRHHPKVTLRETAASVTVSSSAKAQIPALTMFK